MRVFVVIPAYNEAEKIGPVVRDIFSLYPDFQVVVVDDGSTDATAAEAEAAGAKVLRHVLNRGQGAALRTGTEFALRGRAEIIVHFDADGQFETKEIAKIIEPLQKDECQVVLGSRFLKNDGVSPGSSGIPWSKKFFLLPLGRLVNFFFTGLWLSDAHNGLRALSRAAAEKIKIMQDRMAHNSEIISTIRKNKLSFKEVPVTVYYHEYGQGLGGGVKIIRDLLIQKFF